jgi:hypothetical protein
MKVACPYKHPAYGKTDCKYVKRPGGCNIDGCQYRHPAGHGKLRGTRKKRKAKGTKEEAAPVDMASNQNPASAARKGSATALTMSAATTSGAVVSGASADDSTARTVHSRPSLRQPILAQQNAGLPRSQSTDGRTQQLLLGNREPRMLLPPAAGHSAGATGTAVRIVGFVLGDPRNDQRQRESSVDSAAAEENGSVDSLE